MVEGIQQEFTAVNVIFQPFTPSDFRVEKEIMSNKSIHADTVNGIDPIRWKHQLSR